MDILNSFPMIGLSSDWIYRTWAVAPNRVIFEDEDQDGVYLLIEYSYNEEERIEEVLFEGTVEECLAFHKANK
jgi:hypothetical protein